MIDNPALCFASFHTCLFSQVKLVGAPPGKLVAPWEMALVAALERAMVAPWKRL